MIFEDGQDVLLLAVVGESCSLVKGTKNGGGRGCLFWRLRHCRMNDQENGGSQQDPHEWCRFVGTTAVSFGSVFQRLG